MSKPAYNCACGHGGRKEAEMDEPDKSLLRAPAWVQQRYEACQERDRAFFAAHPSRTQYSRPYDIAEMWPIMFDPDVAVTTKVVQIAPGIRTRSFSGTADGCIPDVKEWLGDNDWTTLMRRYAEGDAHA